MMGIRSGVPITTGSNNVAIGKDCLNTLTTQNYNIGIGITTGTGATATSITNGNDNISIGRDAGPSSLTYLNTVSIGCGANAVASNTMALGNSSMTVKIAGGVAITSDARDKTDISNISFGLDFINKLKPVNYRMNFRESYNDFIQNEDGTTTIVPVENDGSRKRIRLHNGFIAQDIKKIIDETGNDFAGYKDFSYYGGADSVGLTYDEFIAPMVKAIQELSAQVKELKEEIEILKNK
jgi:hypothetical protein